MRDSVVKPVFIPDDVLLKDQETTSIELQFLRHKLQAGLLDEDHSGNATFMKVMSNYLGKLGHHQPSIAHLNEVPIIKLLRKVRKTDNLPTEFALQAEGILESYRARPELLSQFPALSKPISDRDGTEDSGNQSNKAEDALEGVKISYPDVYQEIKHTQESWCSSTKIVIDLCDDDTSSENTESPPKLMSSVSKKKRKYSCQDSLETCSITSDLKNTSPRQTPRRVASLHKKYLQAEKTWMESTRDQVRKMTSIGDQEGTVAKRRRSEDRKTRELRYEEDLKVYQRIEARAREDMELRKRRRDEDRKSEAELRMRLEECDGYMLRYIAEDGDFTRKFERS